VDSVLTDINKNFVVSKNGQNLGLSGMLRFFVQNKMVDDGQVSGTPPPFPIRVETATQPPNVGALTQQIGTAIFIKLNDTHLTTGETKLGLASVYIHEMIHAYLICLKKSKDATLQGWSNCIDADKLSLGAAIFDSGTNPITIHHTAMIKNTSDFVAEWLQAYAEEKGIDVPAGYITANQTRNGVQQTLDQIEKQFFSDMAYGQFSDIDPNIIKNAMGGGATDADVTRAFQVAANEVITPPCTTPPCFKTTTPIVP
jgi:hypothetical protein